MNVEIGAEAALFPEKEYINGIAVAVHATSWSYYILGLGSNRNPFVLVGPIDLNGKMMPNLLLKSCSSEISRTAKMKLRIRI